MRSLAEARIKRTRAVELLAEGCSYDEIARQVGFTNGVRPIARSRRRCPSARPRTSTSCAPWRVTGSIGSNRRLWDRAMTGDVRAINAVSLIISQRIRLFGLDQYGPATSMPPLRCSLSVVLKATQERQPTRG